VSQHPLPPKRCPPLDAGRRPRACASRLSAFRAVQPRRAFIGFTLVELLVVIAIIAVLTGLLLSSVSRAKAKGQGLVCQSNQRQLHLAWTLYSGDNGDRLVYNLGGDAAKKTILTNISYNWVNNVMDWELTPDNTNLALIQNAKLGPYAGRSVEVFRCPSDFVLSDLQRQAGWSRRTRSVSMNAMVGHVGGASRGGTNLNNPDYRQFLRLGEFPDPSRIFVFIDEHPDSISDGYFLNRENDREWLHLPASYHNDSANLSFADGHGESHRWRMADTRPPSKPDAAFLPMPVPDATRVDFDWLMEHTSVER
jgi:prepilin-type N-terminal cleavage/methylation domain-containing protein/prepilin-type processing-associated H-X9-DG protein